MEQTYSPVQAQYRPLVADYEQTVDRYLRKQMDVLFERVEPVMIDFASKAETDNAQVAFFDAINHVDAQRAGFERAFFQGLKAGYHAFLQGQPIPYPDSAIETHEPEAIDIVRNDDLEAHIAIQAMITKAKNNNHQELYQLAQRLAVLRQGRKLASADVPASPAHVAITFQSAADCFELEQKILLILFVLFEKSVFKEIAPLYKQLNKLLADAGIYPNLAPVVKLDRQRKQKKPSEESAPESASTEQRSCRTEPVTNDDFALGEEVFQAILHLLTERRRSDPRFADHPEYNPDGNLDQLRSQPEMVAAINTVPMPQSIDLSIDALSDESLSHSERREAVVSNLQDRITEERERIYDQLDTNTIPTADLDTIELVGMLFEHILDDEELDNLTKTLICHLHTPYLKVAIVDRAFLTDPEHISRRLLNLVVNAGRRWIDENNLNAGIYPTLNTLIQRLMQQFRDDLTLFEQCYQELVQQLESLEHKTRLLEERTKEATRGKDRLEHARLRSDEVMNAQCAGVQLHPVMERFLYHLWKNYMTLLLLRDAEAEEGREWRSVLMVISSVIKINNGFDQPDVLAWMKQNLAALKQQIEQGLEFLGNRQATEYKEFCDILEKWQAGDKSIPARKATGNIIQENPAPTPAAEEQDGRHQEMLQLAQRTKIGSWFEFDEPDGRRQRVKLSWYSPVTNNHMFIDRFGHKAFILPTDTLVSRLLKGSARTVEPNRFPFVDQAMKKIADLIVPR